MERWLSSQVGLGLLAALYLLAFPYHPRLRSPNELCRLWTSRALVDHGTFVINQTMQELGPVGDLSCTQTVQLADRQQLIPCVGPASRPEGPVVARSYYESKAPLMAVLAAPIYWVLLKVSGPVSELTQVFWSRLLLTVLPTLVMLFFLRRFLNASLKPGLADVLVVVYGLGTMAFSYSEIFLSHQMTAVLLFGAFYLVWRIERGELPTLWYLGAGAFAGGAVTAEYTGALGVLCVAAYTLTARWKKWPQLGAAVGLVVLGAAPFLSAILAYHHALYGGALVSGYKFLNDAGYMGWHEGGFLGIRTPDLRAFFLSCVSPLRGLFTLSPFLLVLFLGLGPLKRVDRPQWVMVLALLLGNAYFTSSFTYDSWGWTVGPRHLTALLPFLVLPVGLGFAWLQQKQNALAISIAAGLMVSSVLATGLVTFVNYVPDSTSTSLWGLALPLFAEGFLPGSWLNAWVPNPGPGVVLLGLLALAAVWVAARLQKQGAALALLGVVVVVHFGVLKAFTRGDASDLGSQGHLKAVWLAPAGQRVNFGVGP